MGALHQPAGEEVWEACVRAGKRATRETAAATATAAMAEGHELRMSAAIAVEFEEDSNLDESRQELGSRLNKLADSIKQLRVQGLKNANELRHHMARLQQQVR